MWQVLRVLVEEQVAEHPEDEVRWRRLMVFTGRGRLK